MRWKYVGWAPIQKAIKLFPEKYTIQQVLDYRHSSRKENQKYYYMLLTFILTLSLAACAGKAPPSQEPQQQFLSIVWPPSVKIIYEHAHLFKLF